jgi:glycosyltransferase involved in cell wall biosynthesis
MPIPIERKTPSPARQSASSSCVCIVLDLEAKKRGSLEEQVLALAASLCSVGCRTVVFFSTDGPAWLRYSFESVGAEVRSLNFRRPFVAAIQFGAWVQAARPDLVHFHFVRAYSPLVAAARMVNAHVIVHDHLALGVAFCDIKPRRKSLQATVKRWKRFRAGAMNSLVGRRIAVSEFVARTVASEEFVEPTQIDVIEHGIDVAKFAEADGEICRRDLHADGKSVVACVSRMGPEKGVDVLIRAMQYVDSNVVLAIAGDGPLAKDCQQLAVDLGVADRVTFLGLRAEVTGLLAACTMAVVPSLAPEAFGFAVVEAMAAGKPVIVSDRGAMPEIVGNGDCGVIVPAGNSKALADAINSLVRSPDRAARIGALARKRAENHYSMDVWLQRMLNVYREFITLPVPVEEKAAAA